MEWAGWVLFWVAMFLAGCLIGLARKIARRF